MSKTWSRGCRPRDTSKPSREAIRASNRRAIAKAAKENKELPTDLPDPEQVQRGQDDAFGYTSEQAAFDAVAAVILNLDAFLTQ